MCRKNSSATRLWQRAALLVVALIAAAGCSLRGVAVNKLGDSLAGGGTTFSADDDPELIGDALPFTLKLMETVLAEAPRHTALLTTTAKTFTQYSYGWVQQSADEIEAEDLEAARYQRDRARRLYLRARDYGLRAIESRHGGMTRELRAAPRTAVTGLRREDAPLLYWTAAPWALAISLSKDDPAMIADLPIVEAMIMRALELDETFERGAIHSFLLAFELSRPEKSSQTAARAASHFRRAVELSNGLVASPYVTYAEQRSIPTQNRAEFEELLQKALAIDVNARPESRLENLIAQRRARWLLDHIDDLFLSEGDA